MVGVKKRIKKNLEILDILNEELYQQFDVERYKLRAEVKEKILNIQKENEKQHNKKCNIPQQYNIGDLVMIRRTQFGTGMKLKPHFLGPYKVITIIGDERYEVEKECDSEGPQHTTSSADNMKLWVAVETNAIPNGRM